MSKIFARNMGTVDRVIRVVAGLGLLSFTAMAPHPLWGLVGLVPLATAAIGSCPAYSLFGFGTRKQSAAAS